MNKIIIAAIAAIVSTSAQAQSLGVADLPSILAASNNEIRFDRDFKDKSFSGGLTFDNVDRSWSANGYNVKFRSPHSKIFNDVWCAVPDDDVRIQNIVADLKKGEAIAVTGVIDKVGGFGSDMLRLEQCKFTRMRIQ